MDKHSLNTKFYPMLFLFLPFVIIGISFSIYIESYLNILIGIVISLVLSYYLSNLCRNIGKRKERLLWELWGATPTQLLFSYSNNLIDEKTKDRYHELMLKKLPSNIELDFKNIGQDAPMVSYQSWTNYLIRQTRNAKKHPLLYNDSVSYCFKRNLWGLKSFSLTLIIICFIANYMLFAFFSESFALSLVTFFISEIVLIFLLIIWVKIINTNWVKIPAFSYAKRLLETIDN